MKKVLKLVVLPAVLIVAALVVTANLLAEPLGTLPAPDLSRPITLPDGRTEPLGELLARLASERAAPEDAGQEDADASDEGTAARVEGEDVAEGTFRFPVLDEDDVFSLGMHAMREGRDEEALALLLSVPPDHEEYSRAQRFVGWELLARRREQPRLAVAYVNRSLRADPFSGNGWQDASRVYLSTLGLDADVFDW